MMDYHCICSGGIPEWNGFNTAKFFSLSKFENLKGHKDYWFWKISFSYQSGKRYFPFCTKKHIKMFGYKEQNTQVKMIGMLIIISIFVKS